MPCHPRLGVYLALLTLGTQMAPVALGQPAIQWATAHGGPSIDFPAGIVATRNGDLLVVGSFDYQDVTKPETVLYRLDRHGDRIALQASRGEQLDGVAADAAGNYYVTGRVWEPDRLGTGVLNDFYIAKYSPSGTLLWERATGSTGTHRRFAFDGGLELTLDLAGNVCVAGLSSGPAQFGPVTFPNTPGGPFICKYTPEGTLLWVKRVEAAGLVMDGSQLGTGYFGSLGVGADGSFVISGWMYAGPANFGGTVTNIPGSPMVGGPGGSWYIAKFDTDGNCRWVRTGLGGEIAVDRTGNIYFNGAQNQTLAMQYGKLTGSGSLVWMRTIPGAYGGGVALDATDEPVFGAELWDGMVRFDDYTINADETSALALKTDKLGTLQWFVGATGGLSISAFRVVCDSAGSIYLAGLLNCCGTTQLGQFSLASPFEGTGDFMVAKLYDAAAVISPLHIGRSGQLLELTWPAAASNSVLETASSLSPQIWTAVTNGPSRTATGFSVKLPIEEDARFFRLRQR